MKEFEEIMKEAEKLYGDKKWKEARDLLLPLEKEELSDAEASAFRRLLGWCYYYLGKKNIEDPRESGNYAISYWEDVITLAASEDDIKSALSGQPLAYNYLLGDVKKAMKLAKKRVEEAPDTKTKRRMLNSEGCIERDGGFTVEALKTFSKACLLEKPEDDLRTVANVLNNRAVTLMKIIPYLTTSKETVVLEAKVLFKEAKLTYKVHEKKSGESAGFHLEGIEDKLKGLEKL